MNLSIKNKRYDSYGRSICLLLALQAISFFLSSCKQQERAETKPSTSQAPKETKLLGEQEDQVDIMSLTLENLNVETVSFVDKDGGETIQPAISFIPMRIFDYYRYKVCSSVDESQCEEDIFADAGQYLCGFKPGTYFVSVRGCVEKLDGTEECNPYQKISPPLFVEQQEDTMLSSFLEEKCMTQKILRHTWETFHERAHPLASQSFIDDETESKDVCKSFYQLLTNIPPKKYALQMTFFQKNLELDVAKTKKEQPEVRKKAVKRKDEISTELHYMCHKEQTKLHLIFEKPQEGQSQCRERTCIKETRYELKRREYKKKSTLVANNCDVDFEYPSTITFLCPRDDSSPIRYKFYEPKKSTVKNRAYPIRLSMIEFKKDLLCRQTGQFHRRQGSPSGTRFAEVLLTGTYWALIGTGAYVIFHGLKTFYKNPPNNFSKTYELDSEGKWVKSKTANKIDKAGWKIQISTFETSFKKNPVPTLTEARSAEFKKGPGKGGAPTLKKTTVRSQKLYGRYEYTRFSEDGKTKTSYMDEKLKKSTTKGGGAALAMGSAMIILGSLGAAGVFELSQETNEVPKCFTDEKTIEILTDIEMHKSVLMDVEEKIVENLK